MITLMEGLLYRPDPPHWEDTLVFRALPMQFLLNPILIDWAITVFPDIHPIFMKTQLQEPTTPILCFLAYLTFLQGAQLKGAIVSEPTRGWPLEQIMCLKKSGGTSLQPCEAKFDEERRPHFC